MNRFTFGKDWRSWIIGFAWDKRQVAVTIGPFCLVYWTKKYRTEQKAAADASNNTPLAVTGGTHHARRRRRR